MELRIEGGDRNEALLSAAAEIHRLAAAPTAAPWPRSPGSGPAPAAGGARSPWPQACSSDSPPPLQSVVDEDLSDVTPAALIACVKRELALRERVYPGWVGSRRMTARTAEHEIRAMRAVLKLLLLRFPEHAA